MAENKNKELEDLLKEETGNIRVFNKAEKTLYTVIAVLWAIFQLSIASFWTLDSTFSRAIHLAFAVSLIFLSFPFFLIPFIPSFSPLSLTYRLSLIFYLFSFLCVSSSLFLLFDSFSLSLLLSSPCSFHLFFSLLVFLLLFQYHLQKDSLI